MSNYDTDILIENINRLVTENGMTQAQLGEILGMSQPNISKALNKNDKKSFTLDQVIGIAKHFHTTVDALIGGSQTSEIRITQRSTAAFLAELIAQHDAKFTTVTKTEETYTPCWDQRDPYASCKFEKKDITYPAIYLPSYWEVPKYDGTDDEGVMAVQSEAEQVGNDTRMLPVNEFLFHFKEIFEIYDKGGLTPETYKAVLEDMLNRLRDY